MSESVPIWKHAARCLRRAYITRGLPRQAEFVQPAEEVAAGSSFSIVVPVHDAAMVVRRCLDSLERYARGAEVIVVDDGSLESDTKSLLAERVSKNGWALVEHAQARGHSRACEAGARLATRPLLCLLNSDTYVTPWGWVALAKAFSEDPGVAIAGPSTSWASTPQRVVEAMHCRHHWTDGQIVAYARRYLTRWGNSELVNLDEISGFAFFIRRELWIHAGGFHSELDDYGNEAELCRRMKRDGWRLVWVRGSYIHHFGQQSYSQRGEGFIERRKQEVAERFERDLPRP